MLWEGDDSVFIKYGGKQGDDTKEWTITRKNAKDYYRTYATWSPYKRGESRSIYYTPVKSTSPGAVWYIPLCSASCFAPDDRYGGHKSTDKSEYLVYLVDANEEWSKTVQNMFDKVKQEREKIHHNIEQKKKEAESKAYWDKVSKEYKHYCLNCYTNDNPIPKELTAVINDDSWTCYKLGNCYYKYVSDKHKMVYSVDSSD